MGAHCLLPQPVQMDRFLPEVFTEEAIFEVEVEEIGILEAEDEQIMLMIEILFELAVGRATDGPATIEKSAVATMTETASMEMMTSGIVIATASDENHPVVLNRAILVAVIQTHQRH